MFTSHQIILVGDELDVNAMLALRISRGSDPAPLDRSDAQPGALGRPLVVEAGRGWG